MKSHMKVFQKLHWASMIIGALGILLPILFWNQIPDRIPMHYNEAGVVDRWEDKSSLILLFFIIAMLMGLMSIVVYVVKCNLKSAYTKKTEKSALEIVYPMIILMNLAMQCMFAYITFCTATARNLGKAFLPIMVLSITVLIGFMIWKCKRVSAGTVGEKAAYLEKEKKGWVAVYRTKIDWWLFLLLGGTELYLVYLVLWSLISEGKMDVAMFLVAVGTSILILPLFGIKYVLYEEHLLVSMGFYGKARIRYVDIVGMKETMNPISSAAMSLHRIQIDYVEDGMHHMVLVSPKKKKEFMKLIEEKKSVL